MLLRLDLGRIEQGYPFENDLLIQLGVLGIPACDVPIPARYGTETSRLRPAKVGPQILRVLNRGFWRRIWWRHVLWSFSPVALLLLCGLASILVGVAVGAWVLAHTLGAATATSGTVFLAAGPLLLGVQFLVLGLVLDVMDSPGR